MSINIYDFLEGCIEDSTEIYIYSLDGEKNVFEGTIYDALHTDDEELENILYEDVASWEIDCQTGKLGINY